jgi:hypothetical protein
MKRGGAWPKAEREVLLARAPEIAARCNNDDVSPDHPKAIAAATPSLRSGEVAAGVQVEAVFAKFRRL